MTEQRKKLLQAISVVVANADKPERLEEVATALGARHVAYGAKPEHYGAVGESLIAALATVAGRCGASRSRRRGPARIRPWPTSRLPVRKRRSRRTLTRRPMDAIN